MANGLALAAGALSKAIGETFGGLTEAEKEKQLIQQRGEQIASQQTEHAQRLAQFPWTMGRLGQEFRMGQLGIGKAEEEARWTPRARSMELERHGFARGAETRAQLGETRAQAEETRRAAQEGRAVTKFGWERGAAEETMRARQRQQMFEAAIRELTAKYPGQPIPVAELQAAFRKYYPQSTAGMTEAGGRVLFGPEMFQTSITLKPYDIYSLTLRARAQAAKELTNLMREAGLGINPSRLSAEDMGTQRLIHQWFVAKSTHEVMSGMPGMAQYAPPPGPPPEALLRFLEQEFYRTGDQGLLQYHPPDRAEFAVKSYGKYQQGLGVRNLWGYAPWGEALPTPTAPQTTPQQVAPSAPSGAAPPQLPTQSPQQSMGPTLVDDETGTRYPAGKYAGRTLGDYQSDGKNWIKIK